MRKYTFKLTLSEFESEIFDVEAKNFYYAMDKIYSYIRGNHLLDCYCGKRTIAIELLEEELLNEKL